MCGRYSLFVPRDVLEDRFDVDAPEYEPRYNAAPSQSLPVLTNEGADTFRNVEWGLVPSWAESREDGDDSPAVVEEIEENH